jgi:hypothetical protein
MARSEMRWEMGFSASEIASTAFSNPKIFHARGTPPCAPPILNMFLHFGMDKMYQSGIFTKKIINCFYFSPNFAWRLWSGFPIDGHMQT